MSATDPTNGGLFPEDDPQWDVAPDGSGISHAVNRPMPDDRPESPEERLQRARAGIAHLRTLLFVDEADALVAILDAALSTPAGPPGVPYDDEWRDNDEAQALIDAVAARPFSAARPSSTTPEERRCPQIIGRSEDGETWTDLQCGRQRGHDGAHDFTATTKEGR